MMQNLDKMTTIELKRYLSEHRNDEEKFRTALEVLMNRDNLSPQQPYPFDLENPELQVEALLRAKLAQSE
jgi:hypothetical protein